MVQDEDPLISIITVNYNGKRYLDDLFASIEDLDYPKEKLQVIMVDNGSSDGSVDLVSERFPSVEIIRNDENLGYAGGNNKGFEHARGRYIALINNDCHVEKDWLKQMLPLLEDSSDDSKIGAISSKVVFYYPYLPIEILTAAASSKELKRGSSTRRLGVKISNIDLRVCGNGDEGRTCRLDRGMILESIKYIDGFYTAQRDRKSQVFRWTQNNAVMAIPILDQGRDLELEFEITSYLEKNDVNFVVNEEIILDLDLSREPQIVKLRIPKDLYVHKKDIINSCGVKVNKYFYARDRGFQRFDEGQYNRVEEVFAPSGSSLLMDSGLLEEVGYFDERFFTYYEDIDLFWRARLKGWKVFFSPNAVARHYHCGTSKEWSYSFTYHVLRNRMIAIIKSGWSLLVLKSFLAFMVSKALNTASYIFSILTGRKQQRIDIPIRIKVFFQLVFLAFKLLPERIRNRTTNTVSDKEIREWIRVF